MRAAMLLLLLTLLSFWMVCGMLARYTSSGGASDGARIALPGTAVAYEHQAVYQNGVYTLDTTAPPVMENRYETVVPGMTIPKDSYILIDGSQEVDCRLYLEVCESTAGWFSYVINTDQWKYQSAMTGSHGGKVYLYNPRIAPNEVMEVHQIFTDQMITVRETLRSKTTPTLPSGAASIKLYATLVQAD